MTAEEKQCQNCKQNFVIEPEDFDFYKKIDVPAPTFCPECRAMRRLNFWNEHNLFRKKEALVGKEVFSTYSSAAPVKIYEHDYWWSDKWDPMDYGRDYDFSKSFFSQFDELQRVVPWPAKAVRDMVNSEYSNQASGQKNCYMCFNGGHSENCMYGVAFMRMMNSIEFYASLDCDQCYGVYQTGTSYKVFFSEGCEDCRDVWFSLDCIDCSDCFGCVGLRHKKYYIFNKPYSQEDYKTWLRNANLGSYNSVLEIEKKLEKFRLEFPFKYMHGTHNQNVSGDYVYHSKNARYCYEVGGVEDSAFIQNVGSAVKDSYDYTNWGQNVELIYESLSCGDNCQKLKFCFDCWPACRDLEYCMNCHSSSDLFGCVGLQKKQYCIFNKQYSKEEYHDLVQKIKAQMNEVPYIDKHGRVYKYGEFFPFELSSTGYNESKAQDYYPLSKEEALRRGYLWFDVEKKEFQTTMSAGKIPDLIGDVPDRIVEENISCLGCGRAYRIIPEELTFHRRFNLPLPRYCFSCRYHRLLRYRNSAKLYESACQCVGVESDNKIYRNTAEHFHERERCPNVFQTSYAPDRPEIVYCEQCYNAEIL